MIQLPKYFTHYWTRATYERQRDNSASHHPRVNHTAGNGFRRARVGRGDFVYVVTVLDGELHLMGRMKVRGVFSKLKAARLLGTNNLWDWGDEHVVEVLLYRNRNVMA